MKNKILIISLVLVLLVSACVATAHAQTNKNVSTLLVSDAGANVYKFYDGNRTCYYTTTRLAYAGGIWCTP